MATNLSAVVKLRPTRLALLVRPSDTAAIRRFMKISTCMWGGVYHPIIPVMQVGPREWREKWRTTKGLSITRGYVDFFEPDVFVEAESGLVDAAGLSGVRRPHESHDTVVSLESLLKKDDHRSYAELSHGLSVIDVLRDIYKSERRFVLRDSPPAYLVNAQTGSAAAEAMFGVYPTGRAASYFQRAYRDVFKPEVVSPSPDIWKKVFLAGGVTPLRTTRYGIDAFRRWSDDLLVCVFDSSKPTDLIDLWNMRIESRPVIPVPVEWASTLAQDVAKLLLSEHRPLEGNPNRVMHYGTLEFGRSLSKAVVDQISNEIREHLPARTEGTRGPGPLVVKPWRNDVWSPRRAEDRVSRSTRLDVSVRERREIVAVDVSDKHMIARIAPLAPDFANRFGGHNHRWVNTVDLSAFGEESVAVLFPFNNFNRSWPRLALAGETVVVGSEGWVIPQHYRDLDISLDLMSPEQALIGSLKVHGVEGTLSWPGQIAKQILSHLGGLRGVHLLAHEETLKMLNKMAGGIRLLQGGDEPPAEEIFGRRSKGVGEWQALLSRRAKSKGWHTAKLDEFTDRNVLRLGVETLCPHCTEENWHSVNEAEYDLRCERCLRSYPFPQGEGQRQWAYRVIGPFSVPKYAEGAYGAVLALSALQEMMISPTTPMTFSTAVTLSFDGVSAEADYMAWIGRESLGGGSAYPPRLLIGEAKSFGKGELITRKDVAALKRIGTKFPGAILVISVLRDSFTAKEKLLLRGLVRWGRRRWEKGEQRNPLMLLTATELLNLHGTLEGTWKDKGGAYEKYAGYNYTDGLYTVAESTVAIHLGLPSYEEELWRAMELRAKRHKERGGEVA